MSDEGIHVLEGEEVPLGGVYANMANVWHTGLEFTLEFAVSLPTSEGPTSEGHSDSSEHGIPIFGAVTVARLKVPPQVAWSLARMIADQVAEFEKAYYGFTTPPID